jgi:ABC-type multidrug transport system ATPase subunit
MGLPDQYETRAGQRGRALSGGQRQRVAIARAMIRDAPILILDEPTTGLDAESSERILAPIRRLMSGRTTIIVSHNLLTVRDASQILVLDQGRVVESGTHDELLANAGPYATLYHLHQAGGPVDGGDDADVYDAADDIDDEYDDYDDEGGDEFDDEDDPADTFADDQLTRALDASRITTKAGRE